MPIDDDGNGVQDFLDNGALAAADNELVPFKLAMKQSGLPQATLDDLRLTLAVSSLAQQQLAMTQEFLCKAGRG